MPLRVEDCGWWQCAVCAASLPGVSTKHKQEPQELTAPLFRLLHKNVSTAISKHTALSGGIRSHLPWCRPLYCSRCAYIIADIDEGKTRGLTKGTLLGLNFD